MLADIYTPVSAYLRLRDVAAQSVLMESSDYHSGKNARSFIAVQPIAQVSVGHGIGKCEYPDGRTFEHEINREYKSDAIINEFMSSFDIEDEYASKVALWGYTSFNAVRYFENIAVKDETMAKNDAPDMLYILFKYVIEFDHFNNSLTIYELSADGSCEIEKIEKLLNKQNFTLYPFKPVGDFISPLTSCSSYSSSLFATIPPPAWNHNSLLRLTNVRIVIA